MELGSNTSNFGIDSLVGGGIVNGGTIAAVINHATPSQKDALGSAIEGVLSGGTDNFAGITVGSGGITMSGGGGIGMAGGAIVSGGHVAVDSIKLSPTVASASAGSATTSGGSFQITTDSASNASNTVYTLHVTNSHIKSDSMLMAVMGGAGASGGFTTGQPQVVNAVVVAASSATIDVKNVGVAVLNGTMKVNGVLYDGPSQSS